jgi:peptide/nickel transport system substrate-binding protein
MVAVLLCALLGPTSAALAQKAGGTLKVYHRDNPPSASIHEESTISTIIPFMAVFNNLILFDQHVAQNSEKTIQPELAKSWSWNADKTAITFKLEQGVKWHDGRPFTARDVVCTFDMLTDKSSQKLRTNPRASWYRNLDYTSADDEYTATLHLRHPQASLLSMLASGLTPMYPCHVSMAQMRSRPIGTGPFKMQSFSEFQNIRLVRNPDYWKKGRPYLDAIDFTIVNNPYRGAELRGRTLRPHLPVGGHARRPQVRQEGGAGGDLRDDVDEPQRQPAGQPHRRTLRQSRHAPRAGAGARP